MSVKPNILLVYNSETRVPVTNEKKVLYTIVWTHWTGTLRQDEKITNTKGQTQEWRQLYFSSQYEASRISIIKHSVKCVENVNECGPYNFVYFSRNYTKTLITRQLQRKKKRKERKKTSKHTNPQQSFLTFVFFVCWENSCLKLRGKSAENYPKKTRASRATRQPHTHTHSPSKPEPFWRENTHVRKATRMCRPLSLSLSL